MGFDVCKTLYFPDGKSFHGKEEEMAFDLANFKGDIIKVTIKVDGIELPFSIDNYIAAHKMKNVRLYLQTQNIFGYCSDEGEDADNLDTSAVNAVKVQKPTTALIGSTEERVELLEQDRECQILENEAVVSEHCKVIDALNTNKVEKPASALIGSTEERQALLLQQDKEFQESLNADKQKLHKVRILHARAARVDPEPDDDFVTVKVRHIAMGVVSCL